MIAWLARAQQHLDKNKLLKNKWKHVLILLLPCLFDNMASKVEYRFPLFFKRQSNLHFWPPFDEKRWISLMIGRSPTKTARNFNQSLALFWVVKTYLCWRLKNNRRKPRIVIQGTGSRLGVCALIKLLFSDFLVILLEIPLTCISAITYYNKPKWNGRGPKFARNISGLHQRYQRWIYCWPEGCIPWLMNLPLFARALDKWLPGARADSWEIIKRETLATKFHTRAIYSLLIGSLTTLRNNIARVLATACAGEKTAFSFMSMC